MKVIQISVFLENKSGRLAQVTQVLGEKNINIRALSIGRYYRLRNSASNCQRPRIGLPNT